MTSYGWGGTLRWKFPLMLMGGQVEGLACADPGARTPSGMSGNFEVVFTWCFWNFVKCGNKWQKGMVIEDITNPKICIAGLDMETDVLDVRIEHCSMSRTSRGCWGWQWWGGDGNRIIYYLEQQLSAVVEHGDILTRLDLLEKDGSVATLELTRGWAFSPPPSFCQSYAHKRSIFFAELGKKTLRMQAMLVAILHTFCT